MFLNAYRRKTARFVFFQRVIIDHGRRSTVRSGKTVRATHLVTMTFFRRLCDSFPIHVHVFTVRPSVRPWRSKIRPKNPFSGPPEWLLPKNQPPPLFVGQKCQKLNLGAYLGLTLGQKSIPRAFLCLDIPIYTHKYHLGQFGPFGTIWDHLGPFGTIWDHLRPFGTIWDHLGPFGTIWDHYIPIYTHIYPYTPIYGTI